MALDFYKLFGWALAVPGECSPCLAGCESVSLQGIHVSLGNGVIFFHFSCGNCTCKCVGFDLTLQGASVQVCAFFEWIRPQEYVQPGQDVALQFACGIEEEESSSISGQYRNSVSAVLCLQFWHRYEITL